MANEAGQSGDKPAAASGDKPQQSQSKKPDDTSAFKQQRMPAWQPVMSPPWVIATFIILGVIFVPIGIVVIVSSDGIVEVKQRYDHLQSCGVNCKRAPIEVPKVMSPPVLVYYQVDNFFQNHRRYAKSLSDVQLAGQLPSSSSMSDCSPFLKPGEYKGVGDTTIKLLDGNTVNLADVPYNPCGLIAWSMFNDSFVIRRQDNGLIICNGSNFDAVGNVADPSQPHFCEKKGIAWPSDPGVKYVSAPPIQDDNGAPKYYGHQGIIFDANMTRHVDRAAANGWYLGEEGHKVPDPTDLDLMVWMRLASLSTFRKLYRRITVELPKGAYEVLVNDQFPVNSFKGKKYVILTTASWLGGKNHILGGLYIATGVLCMLLGLAFLAKHLTTPRRVGL